MLLLNEDKSRVDNWQAQFFLGARGDDTVVHAFLVDGQLEKFHETGIEAFLVCVERPFHVAAEDTLIFNADSAYHQQILDTLQEYVQAETGCRAAVIATSPEEIKAQFADLNTGQMMAFGLGQPIWLRRALGRSLRKGERGRSDRTAKLQKAIVSWSVIAEQVVRHSFTRAQINGDAFVVRNNNITSNSETLMEHFLGLDVEGNSIDIGIEGTDVTRVALREFSFKSTRDEARKGLFPKPGSHGTYYARQAKHVSAEVRRDIENFEDLKPSLEFDPLAIAAWPLQMLLWLRLSYSVAKQMDASRSLGLAAMMRAATEEQRRTIEARSSLLRLIGVNTIHAGRREPGHVSDADLAGLNEAATVSFCADIDIDYFVDRYMHSREKIAALSMFSRWCGRLYRLRHRSLSPIMAQALLDILAALRQGGGGRGERSRSAIGDDHFVFQPGSFRNPRTSSDGGRSGQCRTIGFRPAISY